MKEEVYSSPIFSVKPYYMEKIITKEKIYEFRNTYPKSFNNFFWIYESSPTKELKYLMEVENPVIYPINLKGDSFGVDRFNNGEMKAKYAYKIKHLYTINNSINRNNLINHYKMTPPQSYTYLDKYETLVAYLNKNCKLIKIF